MSRLLRITGPAVLVVVAFAALLISLALGGSDAAQYALPIATLLVDLSAAGMIGSLVLACFAFSSQHREFATAIDFAAGAAGVMTAASAVAGFLAFLGVSGIPVDAGAQFSSALGAFITGVPLGEAWLATTLIAAFVTVLCFAVRNQKLLVVVAIIAIGSLLPRVLQSYPPNTAEHDDAITALGLHLVFVSVWLGGLITIAVLWRHRDAERMAPIVERYSTLAAICFVVVAVSGYGSAVLQLGSLGGLASMYGILVLVQAAALVALGLLGLPLRRRLTGWLKRGGGRKAFWWLVCAELGFMGLASGAAVALTRVSSPVAQTPPTAPASAEILTGQSLPPAATLWRYLTDFDPDLIWLLACAFGVFFYLAAVVRLRRAGEAWSAARTVYWIVGILSLLIVTNGGIARYASYLFSAHLLGHVVLIALVPVLLVCGAPVTVALRAMTPRTDASRGPHEWTTLLVHSRIVRFLTAPFVATALFIAALWAFYYSPLLGWAVRGLIGRETMIVVLLICGCLFAQTLIGIDPVAYRLPYGFRMLLVACAAAFLTLFGTSLAFGHSLLLADWFGAMGRTWGAGAIADQQAGGWAAILIGCGMCVILAIVVAVQWARSRPRVSLRR